MSHTNETLHYHLPQYVGTDIINPLVDTNQAYADIDEAIYNVADAAATAVQTANEVKAEIEDAGGVDDRIDALVTRADAIETKNVEQDASILAVQQAIATTNGNVAINTQNISDLDTTVAGHTTAISGLGTRVTACETADGNLDARVTALEQSPAAVVDSAMSDSSENAVQNKVIKSYVDTEVDTLDGKIDTTDAKVGELKSATIAAGQTSTTLTGYTETIGATTVIRPMSSVFGIIEDVTYTSNSVTITIAEQSADVTVGALVQNV